MEKQTKQILVGTGIAAAGAAAVAAATHAVTANLVNFALDREEPRAMGKLRGHMNRNAMEPEAWQQVRAAARRLQEAKCETVVITSRDGQKLVGHWRPSPDEKRIILAMHGWRSSWDNDFGAIADFWQECGCSVLFAEQRAHNDSEGEYIGMGLLEQYDCLDWAMWLTERYGRDVPLYLAGISMGATTVMLAAGLKLPGNVRGIMADCGFTSVGDIWRYFAKETLHLPYDLREKQASRLCEKKLHVDAAAFSTEEVLKNSQIPMLFAHGTADAVVPVEMTMRNYEACAAPKHLFIVPNAGHGGSYLADREGYQREIRRFFDCYDAQAEMK